MAVSVGYLAFWDTIVDAVYCSGPGHFGEVQKILPLLTAESPDHPSFHVVAFSLPGFGWSEGTKKKGLGKEQYAEVRCTAQLQ